MISPPRQQIAYDPMAQMMQVLQFALQQNQQGQQQANQDRSFGLQQQQLEMQGQRYDQQFAAQQAAQEQQQQQAIMAALSRAMPQNAQGFDDPSVLAVQSGHQKQASTVRICVLVGAGWNETL